MINSGRSLGITWMGMLISVTVLSWMKIALATGRSNFAGYEVVLQAKEVAEMPPVASDHLDLGTHPIQQSYPKIPGQSHPSSLVELREISLPIADNQIIQHPDSDRCTYSQVVVTQDNGSYLPDGTPMFRVSVINNCVSCSMQNVHIACGDFASTTLVNPAIFKKLGFNDCVVNNGNPIAPMTLLFFEYASTTSFPMQVNVGGACSCL